MQTSDLESVGPTGITCYVTCYKSSPCYDNCLTHLLQKIIGLLNPPLQHQYHMLQKCFGHGPIKEPYINTQKHICLSHLCELSPVHTSDAERQRQILPAAGGNSSLSRAHQTKKYERSSVVADLCQRMS